MDGLIKKIMPILGGVLVWVFPVPEGLSYLDWAYLAVFIAVIIALMTEPVPAAVAGLSGVVFIVICQLAPVTDEGDSGAALEWGLSGFNNATVWLVFSAYMLSLGYQRTGLGRRIALHLIRLLGKRSLGLGYAAGLSDLCLSPFIPSNTARSGGIIYPVMNSIPRMYGSTPDNEPYRIGSYLHWSGFSVTCVTSSLFLTALAPNLLAVSIVGDITGLSISWTHWMIGFLPVGLLLFLLVPWINYRIYPPTVKHTPEMPEWAKGELICMGAPSRKEWVMVALAVLALCLWVFGGQWIGSATTGLLILCLLAISGVVTWSDIIQHKQAWNVLIWFSTLIVLAGGLAQTGILQWIGQQGDELIHGKDATMIMVVLVAVFFLMHYLFASITAHVVALMPLFLTLGMAVSDIPVMTFSLLLCFTLGIMGVLTPYATGPAPIWYGGGFISTRRFWLMGFILGVLFLTVLLAIGIPWLNLLLIR